MKFKTKRGAGETASGVKHWPRKLGDLNSIPRIRSLNSQLASGSKPSSSRVIPSCDLFPDLGPTPSQRKAVSGCLHLACSPCLALLPSPATSFRGCLRTSRNSPTARFLIFGPLGSSVLNNSFPRLPHPLHSMATGNRSFPDEVRISPSKACSWLLGW